MPIQTQHFFWRYLITQENNLYCKQPSGNLTIAMQTIHTHTASQRYLTHPTQANNLAPFKIIFYKLFHSRTEEAYIFVRHAYIADNFRITYTTRGKSECTSTTFLMTPVMLVPMTAAWLAHLLDWPFSQEHSAYLNLTCVILLEQDFTLLKFLIYIKHRSLLTWFRDLELHHSSEAEQFSSYLTQMLMFC